ncbi:hypothetical protein ML462_09530 [Gramella lutea]|uniref:VWFA domain-containing protein n=1 Tax=Christiangramia lutea TaxID=1607951 RepID=A0A9X1V3X3_9FLAO|nr:hypothetical protein [Christiangramia lutea]MCH4823415.1 hypothetical protein [Christiangramia lutea]
MKKSALLFLLFILVLMGCETEGVTGDVTTDDSTFESDSSEGGIDSGNGETEGEQGEAGRITAAEWNDLENWDFWQNLTNSEEFSSMAELWGFYSQRRISVKVNDQFGIPLNNVKVEIRNENADSFWISRTDNSGTAELWPGIYEEENLESSDLELYVNDVLSKKPVLYFSEGVNEIVYTGNNNVSKRVELSFIVDATGSMADELEFLKDDLKDVIARVKNGNSALNIFTSTVFYRDEGDDYVTRHSAFTEDINSTLQFINQQRADGGGDFPEAVHSAMNVALNDLQWSGNAKTRIAFLLLDAPPHKELQVIGQIRNSVKIASEKGIKLIPVTASGINKETEFLMRYFSIATNGTYVFITDDSGIGNPHLEASVGEYEVELLNDLMVRLIRKYSE